MKTASLHITKEILEKLYLDDGLSLRECAERLGLPTHGGLSWRLRKFGIKARPGGGNFFRNNPINKGNKTWLGRTHTKESRKNMVESAKTKPPVSDKTREKLSKAHKGRKKSKEWRTKIGLAHRGHTRSCGPKNPNWQGGIMYEPYCDVWGDREYKEDIKARDGHRCQNPDCWKKTDVLVIHHIDDDKKNCHPDNLITICNSCNVRAARSDREWHTSWYTAIMQRSGKTINNTLTN